VVELREQLVGVGEQADEVAHTAVSISSALTLRLGQAAGRAVCGTGGQEAVLAVALVVAPLRLARRRGVCAAEHGQATACAGQEAAQETAVFCVVAERERGVAGGLRLRPAPGVLFDNRRHRDGNPLLARLGLTAGRLVSARAADTARRLGRHEAVAVGIRRAGVDRIGEDVMHHRRRPGMTAGAWEIGAGVQALEDLTDGCLLVDEPAIQDAHQLGLPLVHHEVTGNGVLARHVAVAAGRATALVMAIARLLQLAAAEALAEHGALVFSDGALDLPQELVVGIVRDRVLQEHDLDTGTAELLQQQDLVAARRRRGCGSAPNGWSSLPPPGATGVTQLRNEVPCPSP